jgi:hypothetical protein
MMNAFTFGQSLAPCAVGLLLAIGFIKWKWKIKLLGRIKLLVFIISIIISSLLMEIFNDMLSSAVVIPVTITFTIALIFGFLLRKNEIDLSQTNLNGVDNEQT